ncbi:BTAD domain-containing putative transcriptional regulator [Streptosporangium fragile]|uniref:BTAD domain-containing putative transcriptional regulator n=1 Tax=Streptosporangium fragile TaxID=46186 RepID=A0ABN3VZV3_9ACTN
MEFRVLGPVEAYDDGVPVDLGGRRQRTVLARLLIAQGAVVSADTLVDDLYGGAPPASALSALQSFVSHLRRAIEPRRSPRTPSQLLIRRPPGYLLATTDVDAIHFTDLVTLSEFRSPGEAAASLDKALRMWRGLPYGELGDEAWATAEVARLRELRLVAVERRAQALLDLGRPQTVISELETETAENPLRERLWCLLALALYRTGRQAEALAVLRHAGKLLAEQLGLDPGPELRALENDILRQVESLDLVTTAMTLRSPAGTVPPRRILRGREEQLAELTALPVRTAQSGVAVAAVSGEPGIGKTRLLEAFRDHCAGLGYLVLWGRCHDTQGAPPLWPWLQVLGALEQHCPPPDRPALAGLLDDESPTGSTDGALLRRNQAVIQWLASAAQVRPLVIILDDLHWADPASLELLRDVIILSGGPAASTPLTLVTAFRDTAPGTGVDKVLERLARYDLLRLPLSGLGTDAVRAVAADVGTEVDEPTARRLAERTGGNPFFVRESARLLAQGRALDTVPGAVAELIRQRLTALGPQVGEVLRIAAVIGRDFAPAVVADVGHAPVYDALDQAVQAGLITAHADRMVFIHDLVREVILCDIPPLRKATVHRDVMTALAGRPSTDVAVIAHHAVEAGPAAYGEAVRWARAAAEQAGRRLAYKEAATWWGRAVAAHGAATGDPETHVELLLRQVRALLEAGDALGARQARAEAVRIADRSGARPELTALALTALDAPSIWTLRNPYEAVELRLVHRFETALRELPDTDSPERARLLSGLAQELYDGNDDPRRSALSSEAIEMARRLRDPHLLLQMLNGRCLALPRLPIHVHELLKIAAEMRDVAVRAQAPGFELLAQMIYTHMRLEIFDVPGADEAAACCDAMLERLPLPWPRFQHTVWRGLRIALDGRFDDAETVYADAERQAERIGMWYAGVIVATGRLLLHYHRGTMGHAGPLIDAITGIQASMDHDARVLHLCAEGRVEEARRLAAEGWPPPVTDWAWLTLTCFQAAAQAAVGDIPACRASYTELLPYSGRVSVGSGVAGLGPVDWFLALLASAVGDRDTAGRHLTTVTQLAGEAGLTWWRQRAVAAERALRQERQIIPYRCGRR